MGIVLGTGSREKIGDQSFAFINISSLDHETFVTLLAGATTGAASGSATTRAMAEEARPKLSIKTERPVGQHVVPPSPTTLLDNGASRAP